MPILTSLPATKTADNRFTVGKDYEVLREIGGNPVIIDDEGEECLISSVRFEPIQVETTV